VPGARFYTSDDPSMAFGLCTVALPGADARAVQQRLREEHRIVVQAVSGGAAGSPRATGVAGLRVTPNVYTSLEELDRFVDTVGRGS